MTVFLVGGSPDATCPVRLAPGRGDRVIAADLGARHALDWGWPVHRLVGDFDSLPAETAAALAATGVSVRRAPVEKDETDLELALTEALAQGDEPIVIAGAIGGRADHALANLLLLLRPDLANRDVSLVDGAQTVRLLSAAAGQVEMTIVGAPGDLLSLMPAAADATGITTQGLRYPLHDEALHAGEARGISNVFTAGRATISLAGGQLFVVHTAPWDGRQGG